MRKKEWYVNGIRMIPTEEEEQIALFSWAALAESRFPVLRLMHHIPNGGKRSKREAARFRAAGVKAGVSDVFLPCARGGYHGLYIELKALDGKPSAEQERFAEGVRAEGFVCAFCYGAEAAEKVILDYLSMGKPVEVRK